MHLLGGRTTTGLNVCWCFIAQLLRDASQGHLHVVHGDILDFDVEKAFEEHVTKVKWEEGRLEILQCVVCGYIRRVLTPVAFL